jgi:hypothetical protein
MRAVHVLILRVPDVSSPHRLDGRVLVSPEARLSDDLAKAVDIGTLPIGEEVESAHDVSKKSEREPDHLRKSRSDFKITRLEDESSLANVLDGCSCVRLLDSSVRRVDGTLDRRE